MKMDDMTSSGLAHNALNEEDSSEIREQLVETAAKFLQNPKVRQSPLAQKKAFLEAKGLTPAEIECSIARSGEQNPLIPYGNAQQIVQPAYNTYSAGLSRSSLIRDYCATIAFLGGLAYGVCHLVKKYLLPYFTGVPTDEERLVKLETQMVEFQSALNSTMAQLRDSIAELQVTLQQINKKQDVVTASQLILETNCLRANNSENSSLEIQFGELHSEIASLKGLLLNRHQFPATPYLAPVIPTWQMSSDSAPTLASSDAIANCDDTTTTVGSSSFTPN